MKRDNTYCYYQDDSFGVIELFTSTPQPTVFIRKLKTLQTTLINMVVILVELHLHITNRQTYLIHLYHQWIYMYPDNSWRSQLLP